MIQQKLSAKYYSPVFKKILKDNKVLKIAVFGSQVSGKAKLSSDIDFLVEFKSNADLFDQVNLKIELKKFFKKDIDIVTQRSMSKYIRDRILREAVYL